MDVRSDSTLARGAMGDNPNVRPQRALRVNSTGHQALRKNIATFFAKPLGIEVVKSSNHQVLEGSAAEAVACKPGMSGETESTYMTALLLLGLMPLKPLLLSLLVLAPSMLLLLLAFCMLMLLKLLVCCGYCLCCCY